MGNSSSCGEVIRSRNTVAIVDTVEYEAGRDPLIESMPAEVYAARIALAKELGDGDYADARALFGYAQQMLTAGEMRSADRYIGAGLVDEDKLADVSAELAGGTNHSNGYNSVITYEDQRDFAGDA
ncbi:MAG TPA: hypothetical protein VLF59_04970 [Candidatus Saccharimonadales bacterium]|nr:hypothetical protein [Candidatus Saccharimonadales bacterium]